jgi:hypothetical protein
MNRLLIVGILIIYFEHASVRAGGSKPGERRGGRQLGTPNKKTALVNATFDTATSNADLSPIGRWPTADQARARFWVTGKDKGYSFRFLDRRRRHGHRRHS